MLRDLLRHVITLFSLTALVGAVSACGVGAVLLEVVGKDRAQWEIAAWMFIGFGVLLGVLSAAVLVVAAQDVFDSRKKAIVLREDEISCTYGHFPEPGQITVTVPFDLRLKDHLFESECQVSAGREHFVLATGAGVSRDLRYTYRHVVQGYANISIAPEVTSAVMSFRIRALDSDITRSCLTRVAISRI
jgi:hypothetical protein